MNLPELGAFLRTRRDRVRPAEVGLPQGPRRRVPGLRREEVAQLAGLSADYYTELERSSAKNGVQPSAQALAALARALRLNDDERDHLFRLAERPIPLSAHGPSAHVQPALLGLLDRLSNTPARVITDLHETLAENDLAQHLLGKSPAHRGPAASFVYCWFTDPQTRERYPAEDHPHHSRVFVADLQAAAARRGRDAEVTKMVAALRRRSQEFAALWDTHDVAVRRMDHKKIVHPALGVIELDCYNLLSEDGRQRLLWFTAPPGSRGAEQLELLSVIGAQELGFTEGTAPERSSAAESGSLR
ncbi:helix-turn-helix domain-containing protein [Streptomyces sp. NPDC053741]|uniref:MmyB family transcriptional regulator n=1 Tax=Streptomyces TaxID=1883 RepID=UPI00039F8587|nr:MULTISPECIES: helix-turn-helix domain-containing protein [Streptomyces]MDF9874568.1 transcriptional regulator with XRE-family HTH domain [Streptomyces pratensis]TPN25811.1 helix-turn-helix domain-containing protein [Mesorhizobium sp. B2-3-3]MCX4417326.1 helix-turn-helix domain-containing protein [[Kitasatospora] papulosa]MCY1649535.1 helix-turn-helix domain-containing protein [Streptomyces sp. SL203]MDF6060394.1 helix-turn-helix domain-containing protein [Streptomyces sp. JH010]